LLAVLTQPRSGYIVELQSVEGIRISHGRLTSVGWQQDPLNITEFANKPLLCSLDTGSDAIILPEEIRLAILRDFFPVVTPTDQGRERFDCKWWYNWPWAYGSVRLHLNGQVIDWDISNMVRVDGYGDDAKCHVLLAPGISEEQCDLSSNFLLSAYGES